MIIPVSLSVLRAYRRRLTNLSSRNRSLVLSSLPNSQFLDLHECDFLLNRSSFSLLADIISRKASVPLCAVLDTRQERSNQVSRKLRLIERTSRFIIDERGTDDLYVGWPFVRGKLLDGTVIHAPFFFFPVTISQQGNQWRLTRRSEELGFLNHTFLIAYSQFNKVTLPDELAEKALADFDRDPLIFRTQVYEWLRESPLALNVNTDLFADTLHFFDRQPIRGLDQLERVGELKLYTEAVVGIFPQTGSYLSPDYDRLIELATDDQFVIDEPAIRTEPLPEKLLHTPLPLDASQEAAIRLVRSGQSLVVQGPPGTGKSQLIANLMADAAADGRRVLLVCQKRAALDVVQARLQTIGMGPFMALVHDFQEDRRALYEQIAGQIERVDEYRQLNNSLNAVLLERDFELESQRIDDAVRMLQAFKTALFDTSLFGISAKELYLTSRPDQPAIDVSPVASQFKLADATAFTERLTQFAAYREQLPTTHLWADRRSFADFSPADRPRVAHAVQQWVDLARSTQEQLATINIQSLSRIAVMAWAAYETDILAAVCQLNASPAASVWRTVGQLRAQRYQTDEWLSDNQLNELAQTWQRLETDALPELIVAQRDLPSFQQLVAEALAARPSWVKWQWWRVNGSSAKTLDNVLAAVGLGSSENELRHLYNQVGNALRAGQIRQEVLPWLSRLALPIVPASLHDLAQARHLLAHIDAIPPLYTLVDVTELTAQQLADRLQLLLRISTQLVQSEQIQTYLSTVQLDQLWQQPASASAMLLSLQQDFDLLVEVDRLKNTFSTAEHQIVDSLSRYPPRDWTNLFQNSIRLAWLDKLEQTYPELSSVSSLKMAQTEQALQASLQRKRQLSRDMLLVKLREQTYRKLTFNRVSNVVTYRDLLHQTTKKRNVWPLRKLLDTHVDEVVKLVPCWLASPESVSAIFPLRSNLFDLVIFDEASQCFAESGLPAFFRGRQLVVTGDSQQLQPSDLYRTQVDDLTSPDDDVPAELELESLLELAARHLPQVWLTEHYRSRSLDLITFSNQHFYQNRLQLLPYFEEINQSMPAIRYLHVDGRWQKNTNTLEATTVVAQLQQLSSEMPGCSVGVVTFNYAQQQLIQNLLDETPLATQIPDLFVKNIENVQGDERDVIIFSIGYAPDDRGKLAMQFGSLNAAGGENRLNVAVTRARRRVVVITSLWPEQLTVDHVTGDGPKRLRDYLAYALRVSEGAFIPQPQQPTTLTGHTLLKDKIARQQSTARPALAFADLTVGPSNAYESLILTDDDQFYQQAVKQSLAYLPLALRERGWLFRRAWSREYWRNQV
ncbi:AAA domain-containing protein [uncultured Spirosoma sp.]|uniref:AAA domain-containing protein n=1 Tax=uncultured Spirosoma sp. TaxID=278208 RepID=UPI002588F922|nr:AAA domain-containing protein [uncultured Spirosoma sp.]